MRLHRTVCALLLVVGSLPLAIRPAAGVPSGFVTRDGAQLKVDGRPWRAIGVNLWDLEPGKAHANDLDGCYYQHPNLDTYFDTAFRRLSEEMHATAVRTFGFREYYTAGGRDYSSTDKLLYYAQKYNIRVIPVLGDQFSLCGIAGRDLDWYRCPADCTPGYKLPTKWGPDYRTQTINMAKRYKDNPTIAFWQLVSEPLFAVKGQERDPDGLLYFVRDMVTAIRQEAGDTNHLINAGTAQGLIANQYMSGLLLDCPETGLGGCTDLGESHDFGGAELNGAPFGAWVVGASLSMSNSYDPDLTTYPVSGKIDGWLQLKTSAKHGGLPDLYWSLLLSTPPERPWRFYIDDALATTVAGPALYSFETDEQGFTADDATISRTTEEARTGLASLAVDVPAGVRAVRVKAPILPAPHQSLEMWIKLRFDSPGTGYGKTTAQMMHTTVTMRDRPFLLGEAGIPAQVAGSSIGPAPLLRPECVPKATLAQRASLFEKMFAKQMDAYHRSSGMIAWDWKDPQQTWTASDGTQVPDKGISCWTITPGDPTVDVFATWARKVDVPPLPPPDPLPDPVTALVVLKGVPPRVGAGSTLPIQVRVTTGGNAVRNFKVVMDGACAGAGKTDALGTAKFNCKVTSQLGSGTVVTQPDPSCECSVPPIEQPVTVGRFIRAGVLAGVTERGREAPVTVLLTSSDGGSLQGTSWSLPDCGRSGMVSVDATAVSIPTSCPTSGIPVSGLLALRVQAIDANGIVSAGLFTLLLFERLYVDPVSHDCVGIALDIGFIGAPEKPGSCSAASYGSQPEWFAFAVPPANRAVAFHQADTILVVTASQGGNSNRKVTGEFDYEPGSSRTFTATVSGRDGAPRALRSD